MLSAHREAVRSGQYRRWAVSGVPTGRPGHGVYRARHRIGRMLLHDGRASLSRHHGALRCGRWSVAGGM